MRFPWMGFIFWVGLFTWFSMIVWVRFLRERERQRTLRAFAESGKAIDGETLDKLIPRQAWAQPPAPWSPSAKSTARGLAIGGVVVMFAGLGLLIGAQLIGRIEPDALWGMSTGGAIVSCVGLGLVTASIITRRTAEKDDQERAAQDDMRG